MSTIDSASYDISVDQQTPVVTRELKFKNGDAISFSVAVPNGSGLNLIELHRASAERVIQLLQDWIKP